MSSSSRKLAYVRERCVNAYWMLREGKFKLIVKSIFVEIEQRIANVNDWLRLNTDWGDSQIEYSGYVDRRRVVPASYRPTRLSQVSPFALTADENEVASQLASILSTIEIRDLKE